MQFFGRQTCRVRVRIIVYDTIQIFAGFWFVVQIDLDVTKLQQRVRNLLAIRITVQHFGESDQPANILVQMALKEFLSPFS